MQFSVLSPHPIRAVCLFVILAALYFATYSGHDITADELLLYDGVHSFVQHGNLQLAYTSALRPASTQPNDAVVPSLDSEPMQVYAAAPLFWIAQTFPGLGLMQTVWLLNVGLTAAIAVILFYYGMLIGYRERTALIGAFVFGVATMAWPYSKTFFREPIFTFLLLLCAYSLERWRRLFMAKRFAPIWLLWALLTLGGMLIAKDAALLLVPTLLVSLIPTPTQRLDRRSLLISISAAFLIGIGLLFTSHFVAGGRFDLINRLAQVVREGAHIPEALGGLLISPGRSVWVYSPVLLLSVWGIGRLARQKQWRQIVVPLVTLGSLIIGYAILQNVNWYGGLGWGPRYLLPAIPFVMLWLLPVIDALPQAPGWARAVAVGITAQSVLIQVISVITPVSAYYDALTVQGAQLKQAQSFYGWLVGTWNPLYVPLAITPSQASRVDSDIAWMVNPHSTFVAGLCVLVALLGLFGLWRWRDNRTGRAALITTLIRAGGLIGALMLLFGVGLRSYYDDPRYGGSDPTLNAMLKTLNSALKPGDAVILGDDAYLPYFENYYKATTPIYVLPNAPGEVAIRGTPPEVTVPNLDAQIAPITEIMLPRIAKIASRWWFITEFIPSDTGRTRVTERYLTQHYFPISETFSANTARIIAFSAQSAPPDVIPPWPTVRSGARFADTLTLIGYDAPTAIQHGDTLPISLLWRMDGWPSGVVPFDYSVNVSLIDAQGALVPGAQRSGTPLGTFGLMSHWAAGDYYRDNHGLSIPADTPPGMYQVWVIVYNWQNNTRLPVNHGDHAVLLTVQVR